MYNDYNLDVKLWVKAAVIRAIKTFAQTAVATIATIGTTILLDVDWKLVISTATLAGILSILTSVAGLPEVKNEMLLKQYNDNNDHENNN